MAEYVFRARAGTGSRWDASSAGVAAPAGMPASPGAVEARAERDIDLRPHRSRPLTPGLVDAAERIVVMTAAHRDEVQRRFPGAAGKVCLLTSFGPGGSGEDLPDPIGASLFVYRSVRDRIESAVADLLLDLVAGDAAPIQGEG